LNGVDDPLVVESPYPFEVDSPPINTTALKWVSLDPMFGVVGTTVTAVVGLITPLPRADIQAAHMAFAVNAQSGADAIQVTFEASGDPVSLLTVKGTVPSGINGPVFVIVAVDTAGQTAPSVAAGPVPFQIQSGPLVASGPILAEWQSMQPTSGPVGTPVTVTVGLKPGIPRADLLQAAVTMPNAQGNATQGDGITFEAFGDPATTVAYHFKMPADAATGPMVAGMKVQGLDVPLLSFGPINFTVEGSSRTTLLPGDLNADGKITVLDATMALRIAVGLSDPTQDQIRVGDFQGDGKIGVTDATLILRAVVGLVMLPTPPGLSDGGMGPVCGVTIKC
jgi:hypothetical protein